MKLNIFSILLDEVPALEAKLRSVGMEVIHRVRQDGWRGAFYYSRLADRPSRVKWAEPFKDYFKGRPFPASLSPFAVFLFKKGDRCFALSYGQAHFHVRPYCDYDFGIELAKRIACEDEIKQTSSRRFGGLRSKSIHSYSIATRLNVQSGESVDSVYAHILGSAVTRYGKSGRFGASAQVTPRITVGEVGTFLSKVEAEMSTPATFDVPRTIRLVDEEELRRLDDQLIDVLQGAGGTIDFARNTFDLYGVDFVFATTGSYAIKYGHYKPQHVDELTIEALREFIAERKIPRERIFKIKIAHLDGDGITHTSDIKQELDFISDAERVVLEKGRWVRFNQDYLKALDDYLRGIEVEVTESEFAEISVVEGDFNASKEVKEAGYAVADKNFEIFKTHSKTPIEAWDLKRGNTVYAVKFGPAQKLGYVCDQATNVLELLRNKAEVQRVPGFDKYCLWLGYEAVRLPGSITNTGSIILKQKVEAWARKAEELGITPVLKLSRRVRPSADDPTHRKAAKPGRKASRRR